MKFSGRGASADVILGTAMTLTFALNIGESLRVPVWVAKLAPDIPTRAFPLPGNAPSVCGAVNLLGGFLYWIKVALAVGRTKVSEAEDNWRGTSLSLSPVDPWSRIEAVGHTPTLLGISPTLFPAPKDYPDWAFQVRGRAACSFFFCSN